MFKLYTMALICLCSSSYAGSYYSCQGEGLYKDVSISGYSGRNSYAGPYACLNDKIADNIAGEKSDKAVLVNNVSLSDLDFYYQHLGVQVYPLSSNGKMTYLKETTFKKSFKVKIVDWDIYNDSEKAKAQDLETAIFTCRELPTGYSSLCNIQNSSQTTKDIVAGKISPLSKDQLNSLIGAYVLKQLEITGHNDLFNKILDSALGE